MIYYIIICVICLLRNCWLGLFANLRYWCHSIEHAVIVINTVCSHTNSIYCTKCAKT